MSKKTNFEPEKNPIYMVIYIAAALILTACLVFFVFRSRQRKMEYKQEVELAASQETEYVMARREKETETETESEKPETEAPAETESETEANKSVSILVLNGTKRPGVAGYWQMQLEEDGYENVVSASYAGEIADETVIYAKQKKDAKALSAYFPDAAVENGSIEEGIETENGVTLPEKIDLYIVIGRNDAKSE